MEETNSEMNETLINSFLEITSSSSKEEATFFLESHNWDLDAAVSTFLDTDSAIADAAEPAGLNPSLPPNSIPAETPDDTHSPDYSPSETPPSRSRSPSPPSRAATYRLRSRSASRKQESDHPSESRNTRSRQRAGNIRSFADLNRSPAGDGEDSDSDETQEYYTGGEKSGMMVQDPKKAKDVDAFFDQARQSAVDRPVESSRSASRSFTGAARMLSGETVSASPQQQQDQPQLVMHTITFWRNGFTVNDGPLRRFDDPENAIFMESVARSECPRELEPVDRNIRVHVDLVRREENFTEPPKPKTPFQGVGRTLGATGSGSSSTATEPEASAAQMNTAPAPSRGLVVDEAAPTTSIQLRLADGTRLVSRFNNHHTIRDVRGFIDASRPGGTINYQLLTMGFPPKQLTDLDQTIEQAGISNSVVIQKF